MAVSEYLETKYSDFIMVSANVLGSGDMLSTLVALNPMVSVDTMVMGKFLVTKYLIMLIQVRKSRLRTDEHSSSCQIHLRGGLIPILKNHDYDSQRYAILIPWQFLAHFKEMES